MFPLSPPSCRDLEVATQYINLAMAAGRGEFYRNLLEGLQRTEVPQFQGSGRGQRGTRGKKHRPRALQSRSKPGPKREQTRGKLKTTSPTRSTTKEFLFERLPSEILMKILSYLDASSLFFISHVNKLFFHLANDNVLWHKLYMSEFGMTKPWRLKVKQVDSEESQSSVSHWKPMYFKALVGQEVKKWTQVLKEVNPYTGLPKQTEWVLRHLNVNWQLTVNDRLGKKIKLEKSKVYYCEASVVVQWNCNVFTRYNNIGSIQLQGVRMETFERPTEEKPNWYSLILKLDMTQKALGLGRDRLIKLRFLSPGLIVGFWRGDNTLAFFMVCLHYHRLVERSLLGSPLSPYMEPIDNPPVDKSNPEYGLHGYTLHIVLHNTAAEILSGYFPQLSAHIEKDLMVLSVITKNNLTQHHTLYGNIKLPWKTEALEGSVENCCIMTLTLLDEFQKPFWFVSSPICITRAKKPLNYSGDHFWTEHRNPEGHVKIKLVWLQEQKQFFLISLIIYVAISKVNKYFGTEY